MPNIVRLGERGGIIIQETGRSKHYVSREKLAELQAKEAAKLERREMPEAEKRRLAQEKRQKKHPTQAHESLLMDVKTAFKNVPNVAVHQESGGDAIRIRNARTGRYVVAIVKESSDGSLYLELEKKDGSGKPVAAVALDKVGLEKLEEILAKRNDREE